MIMFVINDQSDTHVTQEVHADASAFNDISVSQEDDVKVGECLICRAIVKVVKEIVKHSFTREKVQHALQKACKKVHFRKCQGFLNKHFNQLVDLISKASSRGRVCKIMMVCLSDLSLEVDENNLPEIDYLSQSYGISVLQEDDVKGSECLMCRAIVKVVRKIVKPCFTRKKVKHALQKACKKVHFRKCQGFVKKHFNQLVNLITKASSRGRVCKAIMVCLSDLSLEVDENNPPEIGYLSQSYGISVLQEDDVKGSECLMCRAIVKVVRKIVKPCFTRKKVKHALQKACKKVHFRKCQGFVKKHFNQLVNLITKASSRGRVCKAIMVCLSDLSLEVDENNPPEIGYLSQSYGISVLQEDDVKGSECLMCRAIVKVVRKIVKPCFTRKKVKHALQKACKKVHFRKCQGFVKKHFNQLVNLITKASSRGRVCKAIMVCLSDLSLEVDENNPPEIGYLSQSYGISVFQEDDVKGSECLMCRAIVKVVRKIVKPCFTRKKVKHALQKACKKVHFRKCQGFVKKHFNQLVNLITKASSRGRVCKAIMVCLSDLSLEVDENNPPEIGYLSQSYDPEISSSVELIDVDKKKRDCVICKVVVTSAKALIKTSFTRDNVRNALKKVCSKIHKFGGKCQHFVDQYFDRLVDLIQNAKTRKIVCRLLKLCSIESETGIDQYYDEENVELFECPICRLIVNGVHTICKGKMTRALIIMALNNVCTNIAVPPFHHICDNLVHNYFNQLADLIVKYGDDGKVCRMIMLCEHQHHSDIDVIKEIKTDVGTTLELDLCESCQFVISVIKSVAQNKNFAQLINNVLIKTCSLLPDPLKNMCTGEVRTHWLQLIKFIESLNEREICHTARMCSVLPEVVKDYNLDGNPCDLCKKVGNLVKSFFRIPAFEQKVHDDAYRLCNLLSPVMTIICQTEITSDWNKWMHLLQTTTVDKLCLEIEMCPGKTDST